MQPRCRPGKAHINLFPSPPMAKVTLKGRMVQTSAAPTPAQTVSRRRPMRSNSTAVTPSARAFSNRAIDGKGALTPPDRLPKAAIIRVYKGVVVPKTCSPGLYTKPWPCKNVTCVAEGDEGIIDGARARNKPCPDCHYLKITGIVTAICA